MSKNLLIFSCFCLMACVLAVYLFMPAANLVMPSVRIGKTAQPPGAKIFSTQTNTSGNGPPITLTLDFPSQVQENPNSMDAAVPVYSNVGSAIQIDKAGDEQGEFLQKLREWAARDFEGALAGAMKLPEGDERNQALAAVCYGIGQTHPADALALAQTLNLDKQSGGIMQGLVQQWATSDFSAALDWVNNQPAGDQRDGLTQRMAFVLSQTQPADAAALVLNQIPSGKAQNKAILTVLDLWADQDVTAAMAWASSFPDGPLREEALGKLRHQQLAAQ